MWSIYIILCQDGSFYTGATNNVEKRFNDHLKGKGAHYTKVHKPIKVIYKEKFSTKSEALKHEIQIKKMNRSEKEEMIQLHNNS